MPKKFFVCLLVSFVLLSGCGEKVVSSEGGVVDNQTVSIDNVETGAAEPLVIEEEVAKKEEISTNITEDETDKIDGEVVAESMSDPQDVCIYELVKSKGLYNTVYVKSSYVKMFLEKQEDFFPEDGDSLFVNTKSTSYVKIQDSESTYQDTYFIANVAEDYSVNHLSTSSVTNGGKEGTPTTIVNQYVYALLDNAPLYDIKEYNKTIFPIESAITEEEITTGPLSGMLPTSIGIIKDFVSKIDDDYIFDGTYETHPALGETVSLVVKQIINGSDYGLLGDQYALDSTIIIGENDKLLQLSLSIDSAFNESYEQHADNEYQTQCIIQYSYPEDSIPESMRINLKEEKEKADKKNSKNNKKK